MNTRRPGNAWRVASGFTLLELLIAVAVGTLIVVGLALTGQQAAEQTQAIRVQGVADERMARALNEITEAIRGAWVVERPSSHRLEITDAFGNKTAYFLDKGRLRVTRPSGATGSLLEMVSGVDFGVQTVARLRDAAPLDQSHAVLFEETVGSGSLTLAAGERVALGFTASLDAPQSVNTVDGVQEQLIEATLESLQLDLAVVVGGTLNIMQGWIDPKEAYEPIWDRVSWNGGDFYDLLGFVGLSGPGGAASGLRVEVYETRVPGDPRPFGPALLALTLPSDGIPRGTSWMGINKDNGEAGPGDGFWVEIERGDHDIDGDDEVWVQRSAVTEYGWKDQPGNPYDVDYVVVSSLPPSTPITIDLAGMGVTLQPGRGYTVVVGMVGADELVVRGGALGSTEGSTVAVDAGSGFALAPQAVWRRFRGTRRFTQTVERDVPRRATTAITLSSGDSVEGSAVLLSQTAAPDPWLGGAPEVAEGVAVDADLPSLRTSPHYESPSGGQDP